MAAAVAAEHHGNLRREQQQSIWANVAHEASHPHFGPSLHENDDEGDESNDFPDQDAEVMAVTMATKAVGGQGGCNLPNPPTLQNIENIADTITSAHHLPSSDLLCAYLSESECSYVNNMLSLFEPAEAKQDYTKLATLAACIKGILLLNDPSIIEWAVTDKHAFEQICATLEYDPDLREKGNHRWFLRQRAKFRTVVFMQVSVSILSLDCIETVCAVVPCVRIRTVLTPSLFSSSFERNLDFDTRMLRCRGKCRILSLSIRSTRPFV